MNSDLEAVRWTVSSFCDYGSCVEVGRLTDGRVAVRDTKDRSQQALIFTAAEWMAFMAGARAGEFD